MAGPRILFVADAGPEIGGGHVMRCLTLARALVARGAEAAFLTTPEAAAILDAYAGPEIGRAEGADGFDACVFDSYRMAADEHRAIAKGRPTLVIDNMADRELACDLLMEPDPGRNPKDYDGLVPAGAKLLLGPEYALVRPDFAQAREGALVRRRRGGPVERVLVSMGLTDVGGITGRVVNRMLPRLGEARVEVVLGQGAASQAALERLAARDPRVVVRVGVRDMAEVTARADLAVGAGGATIWERCTVGLPAVLVVLAENQAAVGAWLARQGVVETVDAGAGDFEAAFDRAFTGLMRSPERRGRMSEAGAALCDGRGAERVAEAFLALI